MRVKTLSVKAILASIVLLAQIGGAAGQELYAYVGAGLRPPVDALIAAFKAETGITVMAEYAGSGQLLARFNETGKGDIFLPGATTFTDKLAAAGKIASVTPLVVHGPVVAVAKSKAGEIKTFADLAKPGVRLGLGDPAAMALGRTAEQILDASGIGDAVRKNVTVRTATVRQLTLYVVDGNIDAAIVGGADLATVHDKLVAVPIPAEWFQPDFVPVAVLTTAAEPEAAKRFAAFLASDKGLAVFERYGFPRLPAKP